MQCKKTQRNYRWLLNVVTRHNADVAGTVEAKTGRIRWRFWDGKPRIWLKPEPWTKTTRIPFAPFELSDR